MARNGHRRTGSQGRWKGWALAKGTSRYEDAPAGRRMASKFNGRCSQCKVTVKRGDEIVWIPAAGSQPSKTFCTSCAGSPTKQGETREPPGSDRSTRRAPLAGRRIAAKRPGRCANDACGSAIKAGDPIVWMPPGQAGKKAVTYCASCGETPTSEMPGRRQPPRSGKSKRTGAGITIWTDGSCLVNPDGPGGWAAIVVAGDTTSELVGNDPSTTANRMELMAVLRGLEAVSEGSTVEIVSDSKYVVDGLNVWRHGWRKRGWKKKGGEPVKNVDLWRALDVATARHATVKARWIQGHSGNPRNERADLLAGEQAALAQAGGAIDDDQDADYGDVETWDLANAEPIR